MPRPIGILTDRDLVVRVYAEPDVAGANLVVGDVMRRELVVAHESDEVEAVLGKMREHEIRRIPIVDRDGGLQGVIALDDIVGWMSEQLRVATRLLEHQGRGPHVPLAPRFG